MGEKEGLDRVSAVCKEIGFESIDKIVRGGTLEAPIGCFEIKAECRAGVISEMGEAAAGQWQVEWSACLRDTPPRHRRKRQGGCEGNRNRESVCKERGLLRTAVRKGDDLPVKPPVRKWAMKKSMTKNMAFFMHTNSTDNAMFFNLSLMVTSYNCQLDASVPFGRFFPLKHPLSLRISPFLLHRSIKIHMDSTWNSHVRGEKFT